MSTERPSAAEATAEKLPADVGDRMLCVCLDEEEGNARMLIATHLGIAPEHASRVLQRLKRRGLAENGFGTLGYSWFATKAGTARREALIASGEYVPLKFEPQKRRYLFELP